MKKRETNHIETVIIEVLMTVLILCMSVIAVAWMAYTGKIKIEYLRILIFAATFVSCALATIICKNIMKGRGDFGRLISAVLLICVLWICTLLQKGGITDAKTALITTFLIAAGKSIPTVIKFERKKKKYRR